MIFHDRNARIAELIGTGKYTLEEVGAIYGLTRERIRQIANARGVSVRTTERLDADPQRMARAIELYNREMPIAHIAEVCGFNRGSLAAHLYNKGIHERTPHGPPWTEADIEFLKAHYNKPGWTRGRIGDHIGRPANDVGAKACKLGLAVPMALRRARRLERQAHIGCLRDVHGLKFREIAELLDMPQGSVSPEYMRHKQRMDQHDKTEARGDAELLRPPLAQATETAGAPVHPQQADS